jgi:hypothetical protein
MSCRSSSEHFLCHSIFLFKSLSSSLFVRSTSFLSLCHLLFSSPSSSLFSSTHSSSFSSSISITSLTLPSSSSPSSSFPSRSHSLRPISSWNPLVLPPVRGSTPCSLKCPELLVQCSACFLLSAVSVLHSALPCLPSPYHLHSNTRALFLSLPLPASPSLSELHGVAGAAVEHRTLLGRILRVSPEPREDPKMREMFQDAHRQPRNIVEGHTTTLR